MTEGRIKNTELSAIAAAIRSKNGESTVYKPAEMAQAILDIPTGSSAVIESKSITENGTYTAPTGVDGYNPVTVDVSNSYAAADEGKVVDNGALVAQTARSAAITENGTYDTTLNNEVTVNVSGGGCGASVQDIVDLLNGGGDCNLVPYYTSASNPSGYTLICSSQHASTTPAWCVFKKGQGVVTDEGTSGLRWTASAALPQWVGIQLPTAQKINSFYYAGVYFSGRTMCKHYKVQGSNDGSTWADIYEEKLANAPIAKYVALTNEAGPYLYYRILVTNTYYRPYSGLARFWPMYIDV